jgi:hypothetical protein
MVERHSDVKEVSMTMAIIFSLDCENGVTGLEPGCKVGTVIVLIAFKWCVGVGVVVVAAPEELGEGLFLKDRGDDDRIKSRPGTPPKFFHGVAKRPFRAVRPVCRYGVESIGYGNDPGVHGNVRPFNTVGVAGAVVPFVVVPYRRGEIPQDGNTGHKVRTDGGVFLDGAELFRREGPRLQQYFIGNTDLTDVVDQRRPFYPSLFC